MKEKQKSIEILKREKGITILALVITVVLLILAGVSITMLTGDNGIINQTVKAKIMTEFADIKEQISIYSVGELINDIEIRYLNTNEAETILSNISSQYQNKIGMYREAIVYLGEEDSEYGQIALECGYTVINMTSDEFKYYIELSVLEDFVKENPTALIGRELCTNDFADSITVENMTFSNGWYLIGNYTDEEKGNETYNEQFELLGLTDTTHAPYLVNYSTGEVLSINGMVMYESETMVYTFLEIGKLLYAITCVDEDTTKSGLYYGNLYSTSLYTDTSTTTWGADYSDNDGLLEYDENGALILDEDNAIPVLEVNQKYSIDDAYSINITVEGDIYQYGNESSNGQKYPGTFLALSDEEVKYISWIGFYKGYLHVYSFWSTTPMSNIDMEYTKTAFASIDISEYANENGYAKMNIQVVAVRNKETKVYINGELVTTFESGSVELTYNYCTIGDLRVGRNLKFVGKVYDFALYGVALSEDEVEENWQASKKYVEQ